jgi:hypothetical protein
MIIHHGSKTSEDVEKHFIETVVKVAMKIEKLFQIKTAIIFTSQEERAHNSCKLSNLYKIVFTHTNHKVADHNHLSGKFRQTLCNTCSLKLQLPRFILVFLHNLSNYDAHFIISELGYDDNTITVIPNTEEKFISFSKFTSNKFTIRFVDTCRFIAL